MRDTLQLFNFLPVAGPLRFFVIWPLSVQAL